jgi:predicted membrane metal-binding protein
MRQMRKAGTIGLLAVAFILFFVVFPGWVFIPIIPALVLVVVGLLAEKRPKSKPAAEQGEQQTDDRKVA